MDLRKVCAYVRARSRFEVKGQPLGLGSPTVDCWDQTSVDPLVL